MAIATDDNTPINIITNMIDYFIEKLREKMEIESLDKNSIINFWMNINDNYILLIEIDDNEFVVEIDSGEILEYVNKNKYDINNFINSDSFANTNTAVAELDQFKNYFSDEDILEMMLAIPKK